MDDKTPKKNKLQATLAGLGEGPKLVAPILPECRLVVDPGCVEVTQAMREGWRLVAVTSNDGHYLAWMVRGQ